MRKSLRMLVAAPREKYLAMLDTLGFDRGVLGSGQCSWQHRILVTNPAQLYGFS